MSDLTVDIADRWTDELAAFAQSADGSAFTRSPAFLRAFAAHGPAWPMHTFVVRSGGRVACALPGHVQSRFGGAWYRALPFGCPAGPALDPALDPAARSAVLAALWDAVDRDARARGWLGGDVTFARDSDPAPPVGVGAVRSADAHTIDLAEGPGPWRAGLRKGARRQMEKAERLGVSVEVTDRAEDLGTVHGQYLAQAAAWGVAQPLPLAFYAELLVPPTNARLWVARVDGAIVCGVLAFLDARTTYAWWSGSSPRSRETLAFPTTLTRIVEECGSRSVNLGFSGGRANLTDFKEQMGAEARPMPILDLAPRPRTPWHALLARLRDARARRT